MYIVFVLPWANIYIKWVVICYWDLNTCSEYRRLGMIHRNWCLVFHFWRVILQRHSRYLRPRLPGRSLMYGSALGIDLPRLERAQGFIPNIKLVNCCSVSIVPASDPRTHFKGIPKSDWCRPGVRIDITLVTTRVHVTTIQVDLDPLASLPREGQMQPLSDNPFPAVDNVIVVVRFPLCCDFDLACRHKTYIITWTDGKLSENIPC